MNLTTVEDDIVAKLIADVADTSIEVRSWPDNPEEYQLIHSGGGLLVRYAGSTYELPEPNSQKKVVQLRNVQWEVSIMQRSLKASKGHQGIYSLIDTVRTSLTGYTITGLSDASVMFPTGDSFQSEQSGTWLYSTIYAFSFPEAEE